MVDGALLEHLAREHPHFADLLVGTEVIENHLRLAGWRLPIFTYPRRTM